MVIVSLTVRCPLWWVELFGLLQASAVAQQYAFWLARQYGASSYRVEWG